MAVERGPAKSFGMPRLTARGWGYEYAHAWDQYVVAPCECDQGRAHRFRIDLARDAGLAGIESNAMRMVPIGGRPILKQGVCFRRTLDPCGKPIPTRSVTGSSKRARSMSLTSFLKRLECRLRRKIRFQADVPVATSFFVRRRAVSFDSLPRAT
jgi:hypothetical protein